MIKVHALVRALATLLLVSCGSLTPTPPPIAGALARFAVAAAHPLAADAGVQILQAGGNALDAAVAVQMVLALVEPQSSGIGGGAFLLHWDGKRVQAWDGRETAPAAADERLFLAQDGKPMTFIGAAVGGRAVGVPGVVKMLAQAHHAQGRLPWARLFEPSITLAENGFAVSPLLHAALARESALKTDAQAAAYFYRADGQPHAVGHTLRNPALAQVLRSIAAEGSAALHSGAVAADIVQRVQGHRINPGRLTMADMASYQAKPREPICADWKATYRVCGMPPPSSGHLAVMQMLGILEHLPSVANPVLDGLPSADWLHVYTEAARLAFADRNQYVADPDFIAPPPRTGAWASLLDNNYLRQRAALISASSMGQAEAGSPGGVKSAFAPQPQQPEFGTSHISIVDAEGNAVAMTTTIEAGWGSRIMSDGGSGKAGGFLLNNQLTDFSFVPADEQGRPIANRVQGGKRPRSSMSPTLVFDRRDGRLLMSLGSMGGPVIIHSTAKTLIATLDWRMSPQQAVSLPNFGSFNGPTVLEQGFFPNATVEALRARGHNVVQGDLPSGVQAIQRAAGGWVGAADPRREGVVRGQ